MEFELMGQVVLAWQLFAALGIIFAFMEVFIPGFILFPIGVAFLVTSPMTLISPYWLTQLGFLGVNLIVVFLVLNKYVKPKDLQVIKSNVDSLVGQSAVVTEPVSPNQSGYVKLYGDRWQAITESGETFALDERVTIDRVDGNKVVIKK